jgi:type IV pilus assembly protein PilC
MLRQDIFSKYKKVKSKEIVEFSVEVATLIEAGVSLMGALDVMEEQSKGSIFHSIIKKISQDIKEGKSFSEALSEHPKTFSKLYVNMIKAGEATGELDEILKSLSILLEVSEDNKARVKSAMMYPLAMLIVSILVVLFLLVKVLPNFVGIFSGAGIMLPLPTRIMLWISDTVINYWLYMGGIVIGIIYGIGRYNQTPKGRYYIDLFKLKVPIFGDILKKSSISRFTRTFGTLMRSNVPVLNSLEIVKNTANNEVISRIIENIKNTVSEGGSIAEQIEISGVFPKIVSKMITVGENSGALDAMLLKVSDFYDSEVENRIKD